MEVSQRNPGAESRWGLGAKPPVTKFKLYIYQVQKDYFSPICCAHLLFV